MNKRIYTLGGMLIIVGATIYLFSNEEQRKKYRAAVHNGLQAGGRDAIKHLTGKGIILLAGVLIAKSE